MNYFKRLTLIFGWLAFAISLVVYILTLEPSASLWDCAEFIATSYKMEVGHPPGAPLFMMINRFFSMFASSTEHVAYMVNLASATASALTILFLFWTIAHLGRRLFKKEEIDLTAGQTWAIVGAALVGSLGYAFTDTFWFSAVEGEVYAQSSLFTAVVFWAILKWENVAGQPGANRWLIFTAYMMGLSIGVHLLNLLAIPAIVFVYYYKFNTVKSKKEWFKAFLVSVVILGGALYVIIPGTVEVGAWFDRIFVNNFGTKPNVGMIFFIVALLSALSYWIYRSHKQGRVVLNTVLLCVAVMVIGYGSYASVVIRAIENPPMNSNSPSDPYQLLSFLNREQYGNRPLFKGQVYSADMVDYVYKKSYYYDEKSEKYLPIETVVDYEYDPRFTTIFPRMYSNSPSHVKAYQEWANIKGKQIRVDGEVKVIPTFSENLRFFISYQLNFMYWRYFLWNFVGRQNDEQGDGSLTKGNWLSGINFIDEIYLGPQDNLSDGFANNKARNRYYFLPFILGLLGVFFQLNRDRNNFTVVFWLFFMTGIAIILYLNQTPLQPRERDYAFAGSFYAFSIWMGLGVLMVHDFFTKKLKSDKKGAVLATLVCLSVPAILIAENWDDHTRAGRYVARDFGKNYLNSTLPNSIIMPYGDNDTFPLWYIQEVEDVRTDVKIMNQSYALSDWYVNQMHYKGNEAEGIPFSIPKEKFYRTNEYMPVIPITEEAMNIKDVIEFIKNDKNPTKQSVVSQYGKQFTDFIPTKTIIIPVNKENALKSGIIKEKDLDSVVDTITLTLHSSGLSRNQYMLLDMISSTDWSRPIYLTQPESLREFGGFSDHLQLDGMAYRFVPIYTKSQSFNTGRIDSDYLYGKLMNEFQFGNIKDPKVNVDYFTQYTFNATQIQNAFGRLAKQLAAEGDIVRAKEVIARALEELPVSQLGYSYDTIGLIDGMYAAGETEGANDLLNGFKEYLLDNLEYLISFKGDKAKAVSQEIQQEFFYLQQLWILAKQYNQQEIVADIERYVGQE